MPFKIAEYDTNNVSGVGTVKTSQEGYFISM